MNQNRLVLKAVPNEGDPWTGCRDCAFDYGGATCLAAPCHSEHRDDMQDVHFVLCEDDEA